MSLPRAEGPSRRSPRAFGRALTRFVRDRRPPHVLAALTLAQRFAQKPDEVRRILAVKPHDQLGDFLVATPALRVLRSRYPRAEITLVTRSYLEPLARRVSAIDRVLVVPRADAPAGLARAVTFPGAVRGTRPDLAIVLNSVSRSRSADAIAALSGARLVVGRGAVGAGPLGGDAPAGPLDAAAYEAIYDLDLPVARASTHQMDRVLDLLAWLGPLDRAAAPRLDLADAERSAGRSELARLVPGAGPIVGLHPAAANALKCWPVDAFIGWGAAVASMAGAPRLVVLDTPKDPGPAHDVLKGLRARGIGAALLPARSLDALLGPLGALDLLACNDSGMMHAAAALGVATLSFHSLGAPAEWAPRSETAIALHAEAIAGISVDTAVDAAARLLERRLSGADR
jgi:ADP-heptose:LPS heptosyltransferase